MNVAADRVHQIMRRYTVGDGAGIVLDVARSEGPWAWDALGNRKILDVMTQFASMPLGYNHPGLNTPELQEKLLAAAAVKVANSDIYTGLLAECVEGYARLAGREALPHWFFVEGGAMGVENGLKAAFDWKVQKNVAAGRGEVGGQVLHFAQAFHGRSGYTLSLTNTADPRKIRWYPKLDWPRITNPKILHPLSDPANLEATQAAEARALEEIEAAFAARGHDIACMVLEPIQCEGGDNHFRPEFLQELRRIADQREVILVFDEVQTGGGLTGTLWCFDQLGVTPDVVAFAKKMQVGGIMASRRFDEVDSVFKVPSRINSTWGGNLVDMVRGVRILEIIAEENLLENVKTVGAHVLAGFESLADRYAAMSNVRGRGLLAAFNLVDTETRERVHAGLWERGIMILRCGERSIRLRPPLDFTTDAADHFLNVLEDTLKG